MVSLLTRNKHKRKCYTQTGSGCVAVPRMNKTTGMEQLSWQVKHIPVVLRHCTLLFPEPPEYSHVYQVVKHQDFGSC